MEEKYDVYLEGISCGTAFLSKQGLYAFIRCFCSLPPESMVHLQLECSDATEDLGLLIPTSGGFMLEKKLPLKRLGEGNMRFSLRRRHQNDDPTQRFIPVFCDSPFEQLHLLDGACFARRNGISGVLIPEKKS